MYSVYEDWYYTLCMGKVLLLTLGASAEYKYLNFKLFTNAYVIYFSIQHLLEPTLGADQQASN